MILTAKGTRVRKPDLVGKLTAGKAAEQALRKKSNGSGGGDGEDGEGEGEAEGEDESDGEASDDAASDSDSNGEQNSGSGHSDGQATDTDSASESDGDSPAAAVVNRKRSSSKHKSRSSPAARAPEASVAESETAPDYKLPPNSITPPDSNSSAAGAGAGAGAEATDPATESPIKPSRSESISPAKSARNGGSSGSGNGNTRVTTKSGRTVVAKTSHIKSKPKSPSAKISLAVRDASVSHSQRTPRGSRLVPCSGLAQIAIENQLRSSFDAPIDLASIPPPPLPPPPELMDLSTDSRPLPPAAAASAAADTTSTTGVDSLPTPASTIMSELTIKSEHKPTLAAPAPTAMFDAANSASSSVGAAAAAQFTSAPSTDMQIDASPQSAPPTASVSVATSAPA